MILVFRTFTGTYKLDVPSRKIHEPSIGMLIPPIILGSLVLVFGLFPNLLSYTIIQPAMAAVLPSLLQGTEQFTVKIEHWHGWTPELYMTIGVVGLGTLMYLSFNQWGRLYQWFPKRFTLSSVYDMGLKGIERGSKAITDFHMTGFIRDYLVYIFAFIVLVLGGAFFFLDAFSFSLANTADISVTEFIIVLTIAIAAIGTVFSRSRITALIFAGVAGFTVSLLFAIFRAPDLALTQIVVETISVALFLLCFYHLPKLRKEVNRIPFRLTNLVISLGVGIIMTLIALSAHAERLFPAISSYFIENSYKEAGGKNIVNVLLVDFRGFDTFLEILVLAMVSIGVYTLIKLRLAKEESENDTI
ncbi:multisubunit Na+/H+ antiporter MnhB subunit [Bacillus horti]|uniref:Multisubunit Na+/H+ antiporter MnhB subunit n=1 Tax=Caldalkalibacillus horti TaxID=77523 RepID=A0ABT9VT20_9BACI|nr:multisubunit Na+/H+ antiporter MnhB subunit [Bacillus horti]